MYRTFFIVGFMALSAMSFSAEEAAIAKIRPCVSITGADSKVTEPSYHRITKQEDWIRTWELHKGPNETRPEIDFEKFMVIAIFQGSGFNSAGVTVESISNESDRIVIHYVGKWYQTFGPDGGAQKSTGYGFFVIPRSTDNIVLEENVQSLIGAAPVWKERASFPKL